MCLRLAANAKLKPHVCTSQRSSSRSEAVIDSCRNEQSKIGIPELCLSKDRASCAAARGSRQAIASCPIPMTPRVRRSSPRSLASRGGRLTGDHFRAASVGRARQPLQPEAGFSHFLTSRSCTHWKTPPCCDSGLPRRSGRIFCLATQHSFCKQYDTLRSST